MTKIKNNKYINENIEYLNLNKNLTAKLKENNINTIGKVWILKRKELKDYGLNDTDINEIIIKLQLLGLDLNKKVY